MNAIIAPNTAHIAASLQPHSTAMAATIAPTTMLIEGTGKSNIYCFSSINAQDDTQGKTITLTDEEKELLDKWLNDYEREVIIYDARGNQSVRFHNANGTLLLIVFLAANGVGQTDIVAYMYNAKHLQCTLRYTVATVDAGRTLLTDENWNEYITLPSGGNEWIETTDIYDTNLYNAKELCIEVELWGQYSMVYMCFPDTLGAHSANSFEFIVPFSNHTSSTFDIKYDGSALNISYFSSYRIFYRL